MSTYDKRAALNKSMQETVTVDQANIDQLRKSYSDQLADYGEGVHPPFESTTCSKDAAYMANTTTQHWEIDYRNCHGCGRPCCK